MAAKLKAGDKFANIANLAVTESVAGTLTFAQLAMANSLMTERFAIVIHALDLFISEYSSLNSTGDKCIVSLCLSNRITAISDLSQPEILDVTKLERQDLGAAATGTLMFWPLRKNFSDLPGGGILVPADRLYLGIQATGAAAVMTANMRIYYTVMPLDTSDYWELIEARRVMTT